MPQLQDIRETKKINSCIEGGEIEFYTVLLAGEMEKLTSQSGDKLSLMIHAFIKSWNFTDAENKELPITIENVKLLDGRDVMKIQKELMNKENDFLASMQGKE